MGSYLATVAYRTISSISKLSLKSLVMASQQKSECINKEASDDRKDDKKPNNSIDLGLLEEDDDFEEFPSEKWDKNDEDKTDVNVWEANWDDDNAEDDFSFQLRSELKNQGFKMDS